MYTKDYIQATYEVLQKKADVTTTLHALSRYLKGRGLMKLYPSILRGLIEVLRRSEKSTVPKVIVARKEDFKRHTKEIQKFLEESEIGTRNEHEVHIDEHIIGGFIIQSKDTRIDRSHKKKLLHAYHQVTSPDSI